MYDSQMFVVRCICFKDWELDFEKGLCLYIPRVHDLMTHVLVQSGCVRAAHTW